MENWIRRFVQMMPSLRKKPKPENRTVFVGNHPLPDVEVHVPEQFSNNKIITAHYEIWNFLAKNLFEQLQRVANFYFLCIGVIQLIIDSPVSPATSILPLVFVLTVTAVKQGYEDWLRHIADNEVNNRPASVVRKGKLITIKSMHIKVGDIVRVQMNQGFPCDLVLLSSHSAEGQCAITTANLDGETNLKTHTCVTETRSFQAPEVLSTLRAKIICQQPIADLYKFVGNMHVDNDQGQRVIRPLNPENLLLRGAMLKNTPYIYGCVIYTGQETKMALNSKFKHTKSSRIEKILNRYLLVFLTLLISETTLCTCLQYWQRDRPRVGQPWYIPPAAPLTVKDVAGHVFSFLVLFNYVIPISLYVTIEMQKFFGSMFFGSDIEIYDPITNLRAKANTSDLNEDLGQVEYLFTDKTGTLTENDMQFRQCSIGGERYMEHGGKLCERPDIPGVQPNIVYMFDDKIIRFLEVLVLCHTVRVDRKELFTNGLLHDQNPSGTGFEFDYQASSPDEKAFVEACRRYGVVFHGAKKDHLIVTVKDEQHLYRVLHIMHFDPIRRCMSVIVRNSAGEVLLLCKGAESALLHRCSSGPREVTAQHVNEYAMVGLRTFVIGRRVLSHEVYASFAARLDEAEQALTHREDKLSAVYDSIERDLVLLGATAVEDRLQEGVPETIRSLREAGIKVWVLTGDKQETAVNVSYSAGHFTQSMADLRLTGLETDAECSQRIQALQTKIDSGVSGGSSGDVRNYSLVVDGVSLAHALRAQPKAFVQLCLCCVAVLCCRMSPIQKAQVVRLVKLTDQEPVTAAIGDGANDVSMIQEADVGLGIMGKEGRQAVRCSDYAFSRFRFLQRVLLVHGHWYYTRLATLVHYSFYKNIAFITAEVYYAFLSGFSQQTVYESYFLMFYNTSFTALPILFYALFEQHLPAETLLADPSLYRKISKNSWLSLGQFFKWNLSGLWHSIVCFFGVYLVFGREATLGSDAQTFGVWSFGTLIVLLCVWTVTCKLLLESYYITWVHFGIIAFTLIATFLSIVIYNVVLWPTSLVEKGDYLGVFNELISRPMVWLSWVGLFVIAILPDFIARAMRDMFGDQPPRRLLINNNNKRGCPLISTSEYIPLKLVSIPVEIPHPDPLRIRLEFM